MRRRRDITAFKTVSKTLADGSRIVTVTGVTREPSPCFNCGEPLPDTQEHGLCETCKCTATPTDQQGLTR